MTIGPLLVLACIGAALAALAASALCVLRHGAKGGMAAIAGFVAAPLLIAWIGLYSGLTERVITFASGSTWGLLLAGLTGVALAAISVRKAFQPRLGPNQCSACGYHCLGLRQCPECGLIRPEPNAK